MPGKMTKSNPFDHHSDHPGTGSRPQLRVYLAGKVGKAQKYSPRSSGVICRDPVKDSLSGVCPARCYPSRRP